MHVNVGKLKPARGRWVDKKDGFVQTEGLLSGVLVIATATAGGGRLDMPQVFSIPMCATGMEG